MLPLTATVADPLPPLTLSEPAEADPLTAWFPVTVTLPVIVPPVFGKTAGIRLLSRSSVLRAFGVFAVLARAIMPTSAHSAWSTSALRRSARPPM